MSRYIGSIFYSVFLWAMITAACWPVFCAVSLGIGYFTGEGWMIDSLMLEPKRNFIAHFLVGYKESLLYSIPIGFAAMLDYLLLSRSRITWMVSGFSIPIILTIGVFLFYKEPMQLLPTFLATGLLLVILYRLADRVKRILT